MLFLNDQNLIFDEETNLNFSVSLKTSFEHETITHTTSDDDI
jgi:hypothetical protein